MSDYAQHMEAVARALLGEPNKALSGRRYLRFGSKGSMWVCPERGVFHCFQADEGGGVLDLIAFCEGYGVKDRRDRKRAAEWYVERFGNGRYEPRRETPQERRERERQRAEREAERQRQAEADRQAARRIWNETTALCGTLAELYLRKWRGIAIPLPASLRFHLAVYCAEIGERLPALVAGFQDVAGQFRAVHRIWLDPATGNKAALTQPKKSYAPTKGAAIRLGEAGARLALAEGIESGLSFQELSGWPVWAGSHLAGIEIPESVRELTIAADRDKAGQDKAHKAAQHFMRRGLIVRIATPDPIPGRENADWNDTLQQLNGDGRAAA